MDPIIIVPGEQVLYIPVIVVASNQNVDLLPGFAEAFNRHWKQGQEVIAIHSEKTPERLPANFFPVKAKGKESNYGRAWGPPFREFVQRLPHDRFILFLEDQHIIRDVNLCAIKSAVELFDTEENLVRVALSERVDGDGPVKLDWKSSWERAFAPSIWKRDYFCQCVASHSYSIWQIQKRLCRENVGEGSVTMATPEPVISFKNMRIRGANFPTQPSWNK